MMRAFGYEKPLVVGEYNAPWPNLYPEATAAMQQVMAAAFAAGAAPPQRTPEEAAMALLYERMDSLPPQLTAASVAHPLARHRRLTRTLGPR
jgi:hypothetical protein